MSRDRIFFALGEAMSCGRICIPRVTAGKLFNEARNGEVRSFHKLVEQKLITILETFNCSTLLAVLLLA
jgi:hypothetical protein